MVAIGQHQRIGRSATDHVEAVEHFGKRDKVEIGAAEAGGGDA